MAHTSKKTLNRSFNSLGRAVEMITQLCDQAGLDHGRVGFLHRRLRSAYSGLYDHRASQPLDKRRFRRKADQLFLLTVECLAEIIGVQRRDK